MELCDTKVVWMNGQNCGYGIVEVEVGALVRIVSSKALGTWGAARVEEANQKYRQKVGQRYKYRNKTWGSHQEKNINW